MSQPARTRSHRPNRGAPRPSSRSNRGPRTPREPAQRPEHEIALEAALANPVDPETLETSFHRLGLPQRLVTALERKGIQTAFPVQAATLPDALAGRDVLGRARTGSGKTLGFALPMIARLSAGQRPGLAPRGLVLVPTRELATQVRDAVEPLAHALGLKTLAVYGGASLGGQIKAAERGVDIVIATPGRLIDLTGRRTIDLSHVETSVLDEADHMADMGFVPDVRRLLDMTPQGSQRLLFSATLDGAVGLLVRDYLVDPAVHALDSAQSPVTSMRHLAFQLRTEDKVEVLSAIAARPARTIVFVRTKHGADRIVRQMGQRGVEAVAIHGNRTQGARQRALDDFGAGRVRVLVATDVAARGIHVPDVDLVIQADPPNDHKDYLHRSGRTARAGASGTVVTMLGRDQLNDGRRLLRDAGIAVDIVPVTADHEAVVELSVSGEPVVVQERPQRSEGSVREGGPRRSGQRQGGRGPRQGGPRQGGPRQSRGQGRGYRASS